MKAEVKLSESGRPARCSDGLQNSYATEKGCKKSANERRKKNRQKKMIPPEDFYQAVAALLQQQ